MIKPSGSAIQAKRQLFEYEELIEEQQEGRPWGERAKQDMWLPTSCDGRSDCKTPGFSHLVNLLQPAFSPGMAVGTQHAVDPDIPVQGTAEIPFCRQKPMKELSKLSFRQAQNKRNYSDYQ